MSDLDKISSIFNAKIDAVKTKEHLQNIKTEFFGKNGQITAQFKNLGSLEPEKRKAFASNLNKIKDDLDEAQKLKFVAEEKLREYEITIEKTKKEAQRVIFESKNKLSFEIQNKKKEIEKEIGEKLSWQPLPGRSASRIKTDRNNSILDNDSEWNSYIDWSIEKLEKFYHTFKSRLKNID